MGRLRVPTAVMCLALACTGCGMADGAAQGSTGGTDVPSSPPRFGFDDAAVSLPTDRRDDLMLRATNVRRLDTFVVVDGQGVLQVGLDSATGSIEEGLLVLRLDGVLAPGERTVELVTHTEEETLRSRRLTLEVVSPDPATLPTLDVEPARGALGPAAALYGRPAPDRTHLGLLDDPEQPDELSIVVRGETRWLTGTPLRVALEGLTATDLSAGAAEVVDHQLRTEGANGLSYRVAWREGVAGTRVRERVVSMSGPATSTIALDAADAVDPAAQATRVEQIRYVGDAMAVAIAAPVDVDASRPGDRVVATVVRDDAGATRPGGLVGAGTRSDLDDLDTADTSASIDPSRPSLGVRRAGARARVVERLDAPPGLRLVADAGLDDSADFSGPWAGRLTFVGALASRTVIGVRPDGHLRLVTAVATTGERRRRDLEALLPDTGVTGAPSAAVMRGKVVMVVPFGDAAPVHAVVISGDAVRAAPLGSLTCDAIVLDASLRARDEGISDVACLSQGEVAVHEVRLSEQ